MNRIRNKESKGKEQKKRSKGIKRIMIREKEKRKSRG